MFCVRNRAGTRGASALVAQLFFWGGRGLKQSPIFIKSYEMMVWLLGHTAKFPKNQRFLLAQRMENGALDLFESLNEAAKYRSGDQQRAALARRLGYTRARITQLCDLTLLPAAEQEQLLFLESVDGLEPVTERGLRAIVCEHGRRPRA